MEMGGGTWRLAAEGLRGHQGRPTVEEGGWSGGEQGCERRVVLGPLSYKHPHFGLGNIVNEKLIFHSL